MRLMNKTDERRCYECGKNIVGDKGVFIGDINKNVRKRALCLYCITKLNEIIKKR